MLCNKCVFAADDLAFEIGSQTRVVFSQPYVVSMALDGVVSAEPDAPLMRRYPHKNDSRISTYLISTSTSYCWRSEVWLPLNRLPGRRSDEDELGRNYKVVSHDACMKLVSLWSSVAPRTL